MTQVAVILNGTPQESEKYVGFLSTSRENLLASPESDSLPREKRNFGGQKTPLSTSDSRHVFFSTTGVGLITTFFVCRVDTEKVCKLHEASIAHLSRIDHVIVTEEVTCVPEGVDREIDLFAAERARACEGPHQPSEFERVEAISDGEQGRQEALRFLR